MLQAESVTGAARLLNISQPAATKLLQQAERQLGYPLFIRVMGRVRLTGWPWSAASRFSPSLR